MQYRKFGKLGIEVSALGFGAMRFPLLEGGAVDEAEAVRMVRRAIDCGVNYVDTAYPYHKGESERIVGKALQDGYRERTYLATKAPVWLVEKEDDFDRILDEQLGKLQTDHVDFYLLHALSHERMEERVRRFELVERAKEARKKGKIRYIGFSFHDDLNAFREILDYTDAWDFCQIQYNYSDPDYQAGLEGMRCAAERGLGVIVMEPLLGGRLANPAPHVAEVFPPGRKPVEYALDYVWDQPEVSLLLSGMSSGRQLEENLIYADRSGAGMFGEAEREACRRAGEIFRKMALVNCTRCSYCMPCPFGLDIPELFAMYNETASGDKKKAKERYGRSEVKADACQSCRRCEQECPQHILVSEVMKEVADAFAG